MSVYQESRHLNFVAGADLSAKQYHIVKLDSTANQVVLASAATDVAVGVLANAPADGAEADVVGRNAQGTFKVMAGGNVSLGAYLTSDSNGKAVATTTAGNEVIGIALEAGVDTQIIQYLPLSRQHA